MNRRTLLAGVATLAAAASLATASFSQEAAKTVVLVHGAFADGSSWNEVVPLLRAEGLETISVQLPMTSLADDVAFTNRAIKQAEGDVVLVGHSWGGVVITEAGASDKVNSLVYVAGFAPEKGKHIHDILADAHGARGIAKVPGFANPVVDGDGFIRLAEEDVVKYFAPDIPESDARLIATSQGKLHKDALDQAPNAQAWDAKPTSFIVTSNDQMLAPDVQRLMAEQIGARTVEVAASHVPMLSKPQEVASVIIAAAK